MTTKSSSHKMFKSQCDNLNGRVPAPMTAKELENTFNTTTELLKSLLPSTQVRLMQSL